MSPQTDELTAKQDPIRLFTSLVRTGDRVLVSSSETHDALVRFGYEIEHYANDLRILGGAAETLDSAWWTGANTLYSIDDAFRIFQSFFRRLKPKRGILVFSFAKANLNHPWESEAVMLLLRQTGFHLSHSLESPDEHLYFCRRI